jgi:tetratricopeptide (TPR) repeat protein
MPIVDMASETKTFKIGDNAPVPPDPSENKEWMRWNNYGIGLLDAQQYQASCTPSSASPRCAPTTPTPSPTWPSLKSPGRKYDDAKANLAKALTLLPGDPRALYYRALVERNAGQIKEAIADFEAVLAKYPRSKDALRELGFSYYQQHDYAKARDTYERLQAVDPDDLAAHYQLAILYRRLGDKAKAAIESAKFADQKDDPTASEYALHLPPQAP